MTGCGRVGFDAARDGEDASLDGGPDADPSIEAVGELDPTFGTNGSAITGFPDVETTGYGVIERAGGGVLTINSAQTGPDAYLVRMLAWTAAGTLDPSYGVAGALELSIQDQEYGYGIRRLADQRILLWGDAYVNTTNLDDMLVGRLDAGGRLDGTFGLETFHIQRADTVTGMVESNGGYVFCGIASRDQTDAHYMLVRMDTEGVLDPAWGSNGVIYADTTPGEFDRCWDIERDAQGRFVTSGTVGDDLIISRHLPDGSLDPTFATGGRYQLAGGVSAEGYAIAVAPDGDIIAAGVDAGRGVVVRLDPTGAPDPTFATGGVLRYLTPTGTDPSDLFFDVLVQPNGKLVVVGLHDDSNNTDAIALRILDDGTLDGAFGNAGLVRIDRTPGDDFYAVTRLADGAIVATGSAEVGGAAQSFVAKIR